VIKAIRREFVGQIIQQPESGTRWRLETNASQRRFSSLYIRTNAPQFEQVTGPSSSSTFG
jgi:hypothetical protein